MERESFLAGRRQMEAKKVVDAIETRLKEEGPSSMLRKNLLAIWRGNPFNTAELFEEDRALVLQFRDVVSDISEESYGRLVIPEVRTRLLIALGIPNA